VTSVKSNSGAIRRANRRKGASKFALLEPVKLSGVRRSGAYDLGTLFPAAPDENDFIEDQVATNQSSRYCSPGNGDKNG
jgi:hypothetical protein